MGNISEQSCLDVIRQLIPNLFEYRINNGEALINNKRIEYNPQNDVLLFTQPSAGRNYKTEENKQHLADILIYFPETKRKIQIEVKHLGGRNQLTNLVHGEIFNYEKVDGILWIVLIGDGYTSKVMADYKKHITKLKISKTVKVIKGIDEFRMALMNEMSVVFV